MCTFIPTFFVGWYHTSCLSTDERFFLFPAIMVAQVLVDRWVILLQYGWSWGWGHFCWNSLLMDFVHLRVGTCPGFCASTQGLHSFIVSLSGLVSSLFSRGPSLCIPSQHKNTEFVFYFFIFEFFIAQKSSIAFGRGESWWMTYGLDYAPTPMDSPIFRSFGHFTS
jgi:hypothetical protein